MIKVSSIKDGWSRVLWKECTCVCSTMGWYQLTFLICRISIQGVNALDAMVLAYQNISVMRQQMQTTNRVHGIIKKGGEAPNIIPDYTSAEYFVRFLFSLCYQFHSLLIHG